MKPIKIISVIILSSVVNHSSLKAQSKPAHFRSEFTSSYAPGLQIYNSNILFRPGYTLDFSHNYKLNKFINIGLGAGYMQLDDEHFTPIYINLLALRAKKHVDKYIRCSIGYASAYSKTISRMDNYTLHGGMNFRFGVGRTYPINKQLALSTGFSYAYQHARLENTLWSGGSYRESLDYSFLQLSLGLVFNYRPYEK